MADTQPAPQEEVSSKALPGSLAEAEEALLRMMNPPPEDNEESEEVEASKEVTDDEPEASDNRYSSDESEREDDDEEEEETDESTEEEETDDESETETVYTVRVDGKDVEVTEDELVKGYSRQSDYTKKTQELAEYRRQMDGALQQAQQEIQQTQQARAQYVDAVEAAISSNYAHLQQFQNVDWERLKTEDREEYLTKRDDYRQAQEQIAELQNQHKVANEQQQSEMAEQHKRMWMEEHHKMSQILPEWRDEEKRIAISKAIGEYAVGQGYTKEELDTLVDHRSILMLMKAKAYDDVHRKQHSVRSKKVKNKPKVVRSKAKQEKAPSKARKRTAQMNRLRETGKVDDAAEVLFGMMQ
jgi:hypothetical protein|tara:strand:- start:244 stop:1314 length:1071 start_codon:yes stop_codon:yes gene_type:complete